MSAHNKKRRRRTKQQIEQLDDQIVRHVVNENPVSVRHVYYGMTNPRLPEPVEKTDNGYRTIQSRCLKLRRSGRIPYSCITDMSRTGFHVQTYGNAGEFLTRVAGLYRAQLWEQPSVDQFCEIWVESRSIAGVLLDLCDELAVSLYPAGGFTSASFAYDAAQGLNAQGNTRVLYVGDYDPAGVLIDKSIERELRRHLKPSVSLDFQRIAITKEQIEKYDLPTKPRKASDRRSLHIKETVEAEAMPASLLRSIVRRHVESLLPAGALEAVKVAEEEERLQIQVFGRALRRGRS